MDVPMSQEKVMIRTGEAESLFRSLTVNFISRSRHSVRLSPRFHYGNSPYYRNNRREFDDLALRYSREILHETFATATIRKLGDTLGRGLFAESPLQPGDFIGEYAGLINYASRCRPVRDDRGGFATDYAWTYPEKRGWRALEVNGRDWGNESRFVNHSFTPNCRMEHTLVEGLWVLFFVADRVIAAGEQLTVDYGEEYWTGGFRELMII